MLIQAGANVDAQDAQGQTSLHIAARSDNIDAIEVLLRAEADPSVTNENGCYAYQLVDEIRQIQLGDVFWDLRNGPFQSQQGLNPVQVAQCRDSRTGVPTRPPSIANILDLLREDR